MKTNEKKKKRTNVYKNAGQLLLVGSVTGGFAGVVVSLYALLAKRGERLSQSVYAFVRENPAFIPLLFLALALGAFLLSVAVYLVPMIKGSGIPQTEGATRGRLRFKWYRDAVAMFSASLLSIFMGLSAGSEGPSLFIGATSGEGVATLLKRNEMIRRYQVTGGACAGLAVAFNAPLTGMAFAFEEAHKRFTPEVFICAFSSVIIALLVRSGVYALFGLPTGSFFENFVFPKEGIADGSFFLFVALSSLVCGVAGVLFYKWTFFLAKRFGKIKARSAFKKIFARTLTAVLLGGAFSLFSVYLMGGGHGLIESLGSNGGGESSLATVFSLPLVASLLLIGLLKFLITGVNMGAGVPCGAFIPLLAVGACIGSALNQAWLKLGMDAAYCDFLVMVCMATFFTTIVKAPITGIVMVCELTWSFSPLLPVVIGVAIGYFIGDLSRTGSIYEELLERFEEENGLRVKAQKQVFSIVVNAGCLLEKREVRDVLWPAGVRVVEIRRGEEVILPEGDSVLLGGDALTLVCRTDELERIKSELSELAR